MLKKNFCFLLLVLVVITTNVNGQCSLNFTLIRPLTYSGVMLSSCSVFERTVTRAIAGRSFFRADGDDIRTSVCDIYSGTSNAGENLGQLNSEKLCWIEIPDDVVTYTIQCINLGFFQHFAFHNANFTTEMIDFVSSVTVNSTNYPSAYPTDYLQETIITSGGVTEFTITFLEPFTVDDGDLLNIKFDDGTELHYSNVHHAPDPVEKNATKITIQFSTDEDDEGPGFSLYITGGEPPPELTCTSEGDANIRINADTLTALSCSDPGDYVYVSPTPVEDLDTLDPACVANSSYPSFDLSLNNCTIVQQTDDVLTVTSSVRCQQNLTTSASVLRYQNNCINFTCEYNITELLSTSAILPKIIKKRLDAIKETGSFVVKLIFTDDTYAVELPSNDVVTVPNYVHAKAELVTSENNSSFFVQVTRCWATQGVQSSEPSYSIIVQSCEDPSSFDPADAIQIDRNYEADYSTFKFRSFVWTDEMEEAIYLHCEVTICLNSEEESCPSRPTCDKKRRRRDLFSAGPQSRVISSGPLRIQKKEKESCEKKNGGCSDLCEMRSVEVMCLCYEGRELESDGKSCHDKTSEVVEILEVNKQSTVLHAVAIIAISIFVLGLFLKLKGNRTIEHAAV